MNCREGNKIYLYDDRAENNVCAANILKVIDHPEDPNDRLIVYRWWSNHKKKWFYGVTEIWKQELWKDYVNKVTNNK